MKILYAISIVFFVSTAIENVCCREFQTTRSVATIPIEIALSYSTNKDSVLVESRVEHEFSKMGKKDEFYICIRGSSIADGSVFFTIVRYDKTTILTEEFPSYLLMNYGFIGDINSVQEREKYICSRIERFFEEKNFLFPAISNEEYYNEDYSDKEIWDEIQADKTAIGFSYLIGEGDGRRIAFSKKKRKVVLYFNCC